MAADQETDQEDKTEEATPERRDEFREQGQIAHSQELSQVAGLAATIGALTWYTANAGESLKRLLINTFNSMATFRIDEHSILPYFGKIWIILLQLTLPLFAVVMVVALISTLIQTQFNWSWKRLEPDMKKLNPFPGIARLFKMDTFVAGIRAILKLTVVTVISWLILQGEWHKVPGLIHVSMIKTWTYWNEITTQLFWGVVGLMLFVAAGDYLYTFLSLERKMKMSKEEVKEELKQRESDPHVKARLRKMAREIAGRKTVENTKKATVLITNPTHYSIAIQYELGMPAPIVVAKGVDFLALKMREVAKEKDIPIVENKPLARALYSQCEEGSEVPGEMYKAVAEVIKFVFKLKNIRIPQQKAAPQEEAPAN